MSSGSSENEINGSLTDGSLWINHTLEPSSDCAVSGLSYNHEATSAVSELDITGLLAGADIMADSGQSKSVQLNNAEDCSMNEEVTPNTLGTCAVSRDSVKQDNVLDCHAAGHVLNNDHSSPQVNSDTAIVDSIISTEDSSSASSLEHVVSNATQNEESMESIVKAAENQVFISSALSDEDKVEDMDVSNDEKNTVSQVHDPDGEDLGTDVNKTAEQCLPCTDACRFETDFIRRASEPKTDAQNLICGDMFEKISKATNTVEKQGHVNETKNLFNEFPTQFVIGDEFDFLGISDKTENGRDVFASFQNVDTVKMNDCSNDCSIMDTSSSFNCSISLPDKTITEEDGGFRDSIENCKVADAKAWTSSKSSSCMFSKCLLPPALNDPKLSLKVFVKLEKLQWPVQSSSPLLHSCSFRPEDVLLHTPSDCSNETSDVSVTCDSSHDLDSSSFQNESTENLVLGSQTLPCDILAQSYSNEEDNVHLEELGASSSSCAADERHLSTEKLHDIEVALKVENDVCDSSDSVALSSAHLKVTADCQLEQPVPPTVSEVPASNSEICQQLQITSEISDVPSKESELPDVEHLVTSSSSHLQYESQKASSGKQTLNWQKYLHDVRYQPYVRLVQLPLEFFQILLASREVGVASNPSTRFEVDYYWLLVHY